jgi:hypothetical protein
VIEAVDFNYRLLLLLFSEIFPLKLSDRRNKFSLFFHNQYNRSKMSDTEDLTNLAKPTSDATLTIRCIKNFEYRTCKNLVLQHVNLETSTIGDLKKLVLESKVSRKKQQRQSSYTQTISIIEIHTQSGWKPYLSVKFGNVKN